MTDFDFDEERKASAERLEKTLDKDEAKPEGGVQDHVHNDVVLNLRQFAQRIQDTEDPKEIFAVGLSALEAVEQKRFITQNLLEAVKGGQSLPQVLVRYNKLGLIDYGDEAVIQQLEESEDSGFKPGRFLNGILKMLKKFAAELISLICKAVTQIHNYAGLKPVVGFVGTFPNLSFSLEPNIRNLAEILEQLIADL